LSIEKWMNAFEAAPKHTDDDIHVLMMFAMAATYDPDPEAHLGIRLPVDLATLEYDQARWAKWLAWDPCLIADGHVDNLRSLKGLWIDCGDIDQYYLVYRLEVTHVYEEFADDHTSIDYRMDRSLPYLVKALS
jgi:hypothetical protein